MTTIKTVLYDSSDYKTKVAKVKKKDWIHTPQRGSVWLCCLMSSDVGSHIRDKLRPMREHGLILLYVHGNHKAR